MGALRTFLHIVTLGIVDSNEEVKRKNTPCRFTDELPWSDFVKVAIDVAKPIKRLTVSVSGEFVLGEVKTSSGINTWTFKLDFNDYGKVTGRYWFRDHGNSDSQIPDSYATQLKKAIEEKIISNRVAK